MINKLKGLLQTRKTKRLKKSLSLTLKKSDIIRESEIHSIHSTWKSLQKAKIHKYDEFYNTCLYSSIVNRDISILWNNFTITESKSEKNLYGRLLSMTIIEFLDGINDLLGKNLRSELIANDMEEFVDVLKQVNKRFSLLKVQNNTELRKIRNNAAAHKTKKAKDLIDFTEHLHFEKLHDISSIVTEINIILIQLTNEIVKKITKQIKHKNT